VATPDAPGYFAVVLSLLVTHAALAVDAFLPGRHSLPLFAYAREGIGAFGVVHATIALALLIALYLPPAKSGLGRLACLASVATCNAVAVTLFAAAVNDPRVSFLPAVVLVCMSGSSVAAWREPIVQAHR
jgi:hypothetical protein